MKPKYRRIAKFLPAIISISMAATSSAAVFVDDTGGNAQPTAADNGATTIIADGGTAALPVVTIGSAINMTGDPAEQAVIEISNSPYIVNIASGAILAASGGPTDGINIASSSSTTTVNNSGTVSGPSDGIDFAGDFGVVNNLSGGVITGGETGIEADDDLTVTNNGSVTGTTQDGIDADDRANITNNVGGTISGGDDGVDIDLDGTVNNNGTITGADNGINIGDNGLVNNNTNFDPNFPFGPISGGSITGTDEGIFGGDNLTVNNQNLATITGTNFDGIDAEDFATINNFAGGTITGGDDGIDVEDDATITNSGTITGGGDGIFADDRAIITNNAGGVITGTNSDGIEADDDADITNNGTITGLDDGIEVDDDAIIVNNSTGVITGTNGVGVQVGDDSTVTNSGLITGDVGIDAITGFGSVFTLNNAGTITGTGGVAIDGSLGADILNLNLGSMVNGDVNLGLGTDDINFGAGLSAIGGQNNVIRGNISGVQTINKGLNPGEDGVAFIGLPGDPLFTVGADAINIVRGGLYINADVDTSTGVGNTQITAGGTALGGTGTWDADIFITNALLPGGFSAGAIPINLDLDPTNAVGGVTITGDVTHTAGTFIRFDVNPQGGGSDLITQTGLGNTYDLGGGTNLRISSTDNNRVISDGVYTVVDSADPIAGALGALSIQYNANVNGSDTASGLWGSEIFNGSSVTTTVLTNFFTTAAINGTNVELTVAHNYQNLPGLDDNQSALGAALDASTNSGNAFIQDFIAALDNSNLATVQATLASVIPDNVLGAATGIVGSNYRLHRVVEDHLAMTRSTGGVVSSYVGSYAPTEPAPQMAPSGMGNVWGTFSYDWRDSDFDTTDIDGEDMSLTVGVDYRVAPNLLLGILLDGTQSEYDYNGGSTDTDSFRVAIYGTYGESTGLYADFLVGYGSHDLDTSRNLGGILGGLSYDTSTDADSLQALLTVGYAMQSGCVKHGPFGGLEYTKIDVDNFAPSGFGAFGGVDDFDVESLRLLIGYRAEATYGSFTPFGQIAYAHEFEDGPVTATATIPGGATFRFNGGGVDSAVLLTLGTGYSITENLNASIAYHGEISTGDGFDSHGGSIGLNYEF